MSVLSSYDAVSFKYAGLNLGGDFKKAEDVANALVASKVSELFFTNVAASRSTVTTTSLGVRHEHNHWAGEGPFHPQDFLNMMQYQRDISNADWIQHMNEKALVTVLEPSEKKT